MYATYKSTKCLFANVYAPNRDDPEFLKKLFTEIERFTPDNVIIGGDFNLALEPHIDRKGTHINNERSAKWLKDKIQDSYVDIWRHFNYEPGYTWRRLRPRLACSRLDYIFTNETFLQYIDAIEVKYGFRSDHSMLCMTINLDSHARGPGYWKLNTSLLKDREYVEGINKLLDIELSQDLDSLKLKWEMIKMAVRGSTIQFSSRKNKSKRNKTAVLERKVKMLENELSANYVKNSLFNDTYEQLRLVNHELQEIVADKTKGAIIRSRATWATQGEMPTKYFLNLEKTNSSKKALHRVKDSRGDVITDSKQILERIREFYSDLYTEKEKIDYEYPSKLKLPSISEEIREQLEKDIDVNEISAALKDLQNSKAPGTDGLQADFYKIFWHKLKPFMTELFAEIARDGKMHLSARRGVLSLLEKVSKDPLKLNSWRPLTLNNTDSKLFGKILANRLQLAVKDLVHHSQTGFIKGRLMSENIIKIMEIINECENKQSDGLLISFDFYKAFDTIRWESIFHTLSLFGFGPKFINLAMVMFTEPLICASNNGFWSEFFEPTRGCRQGCTFSPIIFALTVEMLGIAIRQNDDIVGLKIGNVEIKAGQFADDLWTVTPPSQSNVNAILIELENFRKYTGLTINPEKCAVLRIGQHKNSEAKFYTLKKLFWSPKSIKVLGINIAPNIDVLYQENYVELLSKAEQILERWRTRNLTIIGKITVINNLVNSLFSHKFMSLPSPNNTFFARYKNLITKFLWDDKPAKIAYSKLVQDYNRLGLKLADLELKDTAIKAAWIHRLNERKESEISWFYNTCPINDKRIWDCNLDNKDVKYIVSENKFSTCASILSAWAKYNFKPVLETYDEVMTTTIWGNSLIRRRNKPIFLPKLVNSNIDLILSMVHPTSNRLMTHQEVINNFGPVLDALDYCSIISAIPRQWKHLIKTTDWLEFDTNTAGEKLSKLNKPSKQIYWKMVKDKFPENLEAFRQWKHELQINLEVDTWWQIYPNFLKLIKPVKLRNFQYRVLTRTLTTNIKRNKWNNAVSPLCTLCYATRETILHLLADCEKAKRMWKALERVITYFLNESIMLDKTTIVLNNYEGSNKECINLLIVALKQYIYAQKCFEKPLNFTEFMYKISYWYRIDKLLAYEHDTVQKLNKKWKNMF